MNTEAVEWGRNDLEVYESFDGEVLFFQVWTTNLGTEIRYAKDYTCAKDGELRDDLNRLWEEGNADNWDRTWMDSLPKGPLALYKEITRSQDDPGWAVNHQIILDNYHIYLHNCGDNSRRLLGVTHNHLTILDAAEVSDLSFSTVHHLAWTHKLGTKCGPDRLLTDDDLDTIRVLARRENYA